MRKLHQSTTLTSLKGESINLLSLNRACPVCLATEKRGVLYSFDPFLLVECAQCKTLHLSPLPSPKQLADIYNNNYYKDENQEHGYLNYAAEEERIARTYNRRFKFIKPFLRNVKSPKVLEIGCALGYGLKEANDILGANVLACDVSQEAVDACQKLGFTAQVTDEYGICEAIEKESLDMVYAFDVIEHLIDFPRFIRWLDKILKPGGLFFVTTPDMNHILNRILGSRSPSIKIPQHTIYFTTDTLEGALNPTFKCIAHSWDYQYVGLSMVLSRLGHILNLPQLNGLYGPTVSVPNGMRMYVFKKT